VVLVAELAGTFTEKMIRGADVLAGDWHSSLRQSNASP
jgi:hypothetical protein